MVSKMSHTSCLDVIIPRSALCAASMPQFTGPLFLSLHNPASRRCPYLCHSPCRMSIDMLTFLNQQKQQTSSQKKKTDFLPEEQHPFHFELLVVDFNEKKEKKKSADSVITTGVEKERMLFCVLQHPMDAETHINIPFGE